METDITVDKIAAVFPGLPETDQHESGPPSAVRSNRIISGFRKEAVELLIRLNIAKIILKNCRSPILLFKMLRTLDRYRRLILGESRIKKIAKVGKSYYWDLYIPGWPSKAFDNFFKSELNRIAPLHKETNRFTNIFVAITKKCPLRCEHCFEWDALNGKEKLTLADIKNIVQKFQERGTAQFQITGGEPMLRVNDIVEIVRSARRETEFWILTSGFNLTSENARKLKAAGLTGAVVSLDHVDPEMHNLFRGFKDSFHWVERAVCNSIASNLVTALSICVTKTFVTESNLMRYAELAKGLGVSFIQILEPKAVGHYKGKDVSLSVEQEKMLEKFYWKMNYDRNYRAYPVISYHGFYQRRIGCFASGNRNLYIDTDGDLHACPFCQTKGGSALSEDLDNSIQQLQAVGCHRFKDANI